jgi:hypothetical protein
MDDQPGDNGDEEITNSDKICLGIFILPEGEIQAEDLRSEAALKQPVNLITKI